MMCKEYAEGWIDAIAWFNALIYEKATANKSYECLALSIELTQQLNDKIDEFIGEPENDSEC